MKCIIIEDEPLAQQRLKTYLGKIPGTELIAAFTNAPEALHFLQCTPEDVDLVFLDIHLGSLSGIQILEMKLLNIPVIITTAYQDYALKGYELNVLDYLLKPFTFERFLQAVHKLPSPDTNPGLPLRDFIFIKTAHRLERVLLSDLLYIEGMDDYRKIVCTDRTLTTLTTFLLFEREFPPQQFCRVHRSFMVNIANITSIERDHIVFPGRMIPISLTYKKRFYERLGTGLTLYLFPDIKDIACNHKKEKVTGSAPR